MKCPRCGKPTRVKETREPNGMRHNAIQTLAEDWPDLVIRRRACPTHGTYLTVELPL